MEGGLAYDDTNVFARILRGELPSYKVYEDATTLAFLDIMPTTRGHTLVLPKARVAQLYDIGDADLAALMSTVRRVARAARRAFAADGISLAQFNEAAGGQSVFHLHFHVQPRWEGVPLRPHGAVKADPAALAADAALLRAAMAEEG